MDNRSKGWGNTDYWAKTCSNLNPASRVLQSKVTHSLWDYLNASERMLFFLIRLKMMPQDMKDDLTFLFHISVVAIISPNTWRLLRVDIKAKCPHRGFLLHHVMVSMSGTMCVIFLLLFGHETQFYLFLFCFCLLLFFFCSYILLLLINQIKSTITLFPGLLQLSSNDETDEHIRVTGGIKTHSDTSKDTREKSLNYE